MPEDVPPHKQNVDRVWDRLATEPAPSFRIMSYNVLSDELLWKNRYLYGRNTPRPLLDWNNRFQLILKHIAQYAPDFLCLQEVDKHHLVSDFIPSLDPLGYDYHYTRRTQQPNSYNDGLLTLWLRDKYAHHQPSQCVTYNQNSVLNRENAAQINVFQDRAQPDRLLVLANTHLLFNPTQIALKTGQIHFLLTQIGLVYRSLAPCVPPMIIAGDFNAPPNSKVIELLSQGHAPFPTHTLVQPFHLTPVYPCSVRNDVDHVSTFSHNGINQLVDHLFFGTCDLDPSTLIQIPPLPDSQSIHPFKFVHSNWCIPFGCTTRSATNAESPSTSTAWVPGTPWFHNCPGRWVLTPIKALSLPLRSTVTPIPDASEGSDHFSLVADLAFVWQERPPDSSLNGLL